MTASRVVITATRDRVRGTWNLSAVVDGYLVHMSYYGYTKAAAVRMFRRSLGLTARGAVEVR